MIYAHTPVDTGSWFSKKKKKAVGKLKLHKKSIQLKSCFTPEVAYETALLLKAQCVIFSET